MAAGAGLVSDGGGEIHALDVNFGFLGEECSALETQAHITYKCFVFIEHEHFVRSVYVGGGKAGIPRRKILVSLNIYISEIVVGL